MNPKVLKMGVGRVGAGQALRSGGVLTVVLLSAYRVLDFFLRDGATLTELVGSLATDVVKVALSVGAGLAVAAIPGVAAFAAGPLLAVVLVPAVAAWGLGKLDDHLGITEQLVEALDRLPVALTGVTQDLSDAVKEAFAEEQQQSPGRSLVVDLADEAVAELIRGAGRVAKRRLLREVEELTWVVPKVWF